MENEYVNTSCFAISVVLLVCWSSEYPHDADADTWSSTVDIESRSPTWYQLDDLDRLRGDRMSPGHTAYDVHLLPLQSQERRP